MFLQVPDALSIDDLMEQRVPDPMFLTETENSFYVFLPSFQWLSLLRNAFYRSAAVVNRFRDSRITRSEFNTLVGVAL